MAFSCHSYPLIISNSDIPTTDQLSCDNISPSMKESCDDDSSHACDRFGFFLDSDHAHCTTDPDLSKVLIRSGLLLVVVVVLQLLFKLEGCYVSLDQPL